MSDMAGLALTTERRDQLAKLLNDERLLEAKYPKVADYLDTAMRLSGSGDDQADAAFDLRFVHFMTGGQSVSANPYWDIVAPSVHERDGRRVVDGGNADGSPRLLFAQMALQAAYAYAIPSPETLKWVSGFCDGRPISELGAGRAYWAGQLSRAGQTISAYELEPPHEAENVSFPHAEGQADVWHRVSGLDGFSFDGHADDVLFLCWPPGWGNSMASTALADFESSGGSRLIYIGEPKGGKTGDDAFFDALSDRWRLDSVDPQFVSWWNLADTAQGWVRQR
ncbi:hypothetical protein ABH926_002619 [Catenulispora sp. GP43]